MEDPKNINIGLQFIIPICFAFAFGITIVLLHVGLHERKKYLKLVLRSIIVYTFIYIVFITIQFISDIQIQIEYNKYHYNTDNLVMNEKYLKAYEQAEAALIGDAGRNLAFFFGLILGFPITVVYYIIENIVYFVRRRYG